MVDALSLIFSIIAICVSVFVAYKEYQRDLKINETNLEATYFDEIYKQHLIYKIPKARRYLRIASNNQIADDQPLIDELNAIRKESLYFLYTNKPFYDSLILKLQQLEDFLVSSEAKQLVGEEQTEFFSQVQTYMNEIYTHITSAYKGKS